MRPFCCGVGGDELLAEGVVAAGGAKAASGEDEPVVAPHGRRHALGTHDHYNVFSLIGEEPP